MKGNRDHFIALRKKMDRVGSVFLELQTIQMKDKMDGALQAGGAYFKGDLLS